MEKTFPADVKSLADIRGVVADATRRFRMPVDDRQDLLLAVSEASSNAIVHSGSPTIHVSCRAVLDTLTVRVRDEGVFRWGVRSRAGMGLALMRRMTDRMEIDEGIPERPGTTVTLDKALPSWSTRSAHYREQAHRNRLAIAAASTLCAHTRAWAAEQAEVWLSQPTRTAPPSAREGADPSRGARRFGAA